MSDKRESYYEKIRILRDLLDKALNYQDYDIAFEQKSSFLFSPIDLTLDIIIDHLIVARDLLDLGASGMNPNQGLAFSDTEIDSLCNPLQIRINYPRKYYWDPNAVQYFNGLIQAFIRIKRQESIKNSFMEFIESLYLKSSPIQRRKSEVMSRKSQSQYHYWRRRRRQKSRRAGTNP